MHKIFFIAIAGLLQAAMTTPATAQSTGSSPEAVLQRHIDAMHKRDWEAVLRDIAPNAVYIGEPDQEIIQGKEEIREHYVRLAKMWSTQEVNWEAKVVPGSRDIVFEDWINSPGQPNAMKGRDVFIIRDGKILVLVVTNIRPASQP